MLATFNDFNIYIFMVLYGYFAMNISDNITDILVSTYLSIYNNIIIFQPTLNARFYETSYDDNIYSVKQSQFY